MNVENHGTYSLLEARIHRISGHGFVCTAQKIIVKTFKNFFGSTWSEREEIDIKLSRLECLSMQITKQCYNQPMTCVDDTCYSKIEPKLRYEWESTLQ